MLPFHVARFFRPTVLEVLGLNNTELGAAQAIYGIVAMLCYFPGGPLADRYSARKLLALSLWITAGGGLYMATLPEFEGAIAVWGFFGFSTILLFWAALIRATREWGGVDEQGRAYGLLDSGRGVLAAALASVAVFVFSLLFPEGIASASFQDKKLALQVIIHVYTAATFLAGVIVWFALPDGQPNEQNNPAQWRADSENVWLHIKHVICLPAVWFISIIVICAYVAYKGFDNYSLYAVQGFGLSEVDAAQIVTIGAWARPVAALGAGLLGDRYQVSRMTVVCFFVLLMSQLFFATYTPQPGVAWVLLLNILIGSSAMFGLRALYFALLEDAKVPATVTGTAIGLISVLGYTPDIFVSYAGGVLLDNSPGLLGHQHYFYFLATFAAIGLLASYALKRLLDANAQSPR